MTRLWEAAHVHRTLLFTRKIVSAQIFKFVLYFNKTSIYTINPFKNRCYRLKYSWRSSIDLRMDYSKPSVHHLCSSAVVTLACSALIQWTLPVNQFKQTCDQRMKSPWALKKPQATAFKIYTLCYTVQYIINLMETRPDFCSHVYFPPLLLWYESLI